ncbi:MAG TPA: sigma 54-interacting transcriptional regulator [Desulfobacterales bacterium]
MFENTGTAMFIKEKDGEISIVNSGFEALTGFSKSQIQERMQWIDFFHPDDRSRLAALQPPWRRDNGPPDECECRLVDRSGGVKHVLLKLNGIPGTHRVVGSIVDVTQLKMAREEVREGQSLLKAIVDSFDGSIYVSSADYELQYMNQQLIERLGRNATGEICYEAIHQRKFVCPFCVMDQVRSGQTVEFQIRNPGEQRWYQSVNSPIRHTDGSISLVALIRDIHEEKRIETTLRESQDHLKKENLILRSRIQERQQFGGIVGKSPGMQKVYQQIVNAAASDATVIIYGEPGTGKELVAHAIHEMSGRRDNRFVPVHCGAIPDNLIESEFFGYKKGAFSGAASDRQGYIDYADGGTLFLDEVGEIALHMQVKLLRVIDGGGYTPVGTSQVKNADIRIVAATNRDLKRRIAQGSIREDFFYRIHVLPIHLPPLRQRKEDLPLLVDHFLRIYSEKQNLPPITGEMLDRLYRHDWPGNVRELQNVIIRYCSLKKLDLSSTSVSRPAPRIGLPGGPPPVENQTLRDTLRQYEKRVLENVLQQHHWHRSNAARALGIDRKTLFTKMKDLGLNEPQNGE